MFLSVTFKSKPGGDFVRTTEVSSAKDFARVERAAAAWAKSQLRSMPLFGHVVRRELSMQIEWVDARSVLAEKPAPPPAPATHRKKRKK